MKEKQKFNLTDGQKKEFQKAALATWDIIAYDTLQCVAESKEKNINQVTMKRSEVIEIVLDADYIMMYGGIKDPVVKDFYKNGDYNQMIDIVKEVFTYSKYGI
jgi:hypothetical protein